MDIKHEYKTKEPETFTQCLLHRLQFDDTKLVHVAWIPSQFAVVGKMLDIKINGEWVDHCEVKEVYDTKSADDTCGCLGWCARDGCLMDLRW